MQSKSGGRTRYDTMIVGTVVRHTVRTKKITRCTPYLFSAAINNGISKTTHCTVTIIARHKNVTTYTTSSWGLADDCWRVLNTTFLISRCWRLTVVFIFPITYRSHRHFVFLPIPLSLPPPATTKTATISSSIQNISKQASYIHHGQNYTSHTFIH